MIVRPRKADWWRVPWSHANIVAQKARDFAKIAMAKVARGEYPKPRAKLAQAEAKI